MADEVGHSADALMDRLEAEPERFDFFQAMRALECAFPDKPRVGRAQRATDESVRLGQQPHLHFAPSALYSFEQGDTEHKARLLVYFLGLLGPNGPLPLTLSEYVYDRVHGHDDTAIAGFLDLFHHRMLTFFYRAWSSSRQAVSYDRAEDDRFVAYVGSAFGVGMDTFRQRDAVPDEAKLHFAGHLSCPTKHASGLRSLLETYFRLPVAIEQFVGQWMLLPHEYRCRLGEDTDTCTLGRTVVVGSRVWDCQQKFRVRMGPMSFKHYERLLPTGSSFARLRDWVRNYVGDELDWDARLVLKAEEVPKTQLGKAGQLGWTTWLKSKPFARDADDLCLSARAA